MPQDLPGTIWQIDRATASDSGVQGWLAALANVRAVVFAWVNDEDTKRGCESSNDAYRVFRKMLESGHPPDDWNQLLAEARAEGQRLQRFAAGITP